MSLLTMIKIASKKKKIKLDGKTFFLYKYLLILILSVTDK